MYHELFRAAAQRATVLTGSKHLARYLNEQFTAYQRDKGRSVWKTPDIISWDAFLQRRWREWMMTGATDGPVLLNASQEAAVWESVIAGSPEGRTLLRIPETAQAAMDAWALVRAYRLPFEAGEFAGSEDCEAFHSWAIQFQERRHANNWLEASGLPDALSGLQESGDIHVIGLSEPTPQQQDLIRALGATQAPLTGRQAHTQKASFRDSAAELRAAAEWTRNLLEKNGAAQIGIVVPNLAVLRAQVDRIFRDVLHPGSNEDAFHISLGPPLSQNPVAHAALLILECACAPMPLERAGMLLRSPFLRGADREVSRRAGIDRELRRLKFTTVNIGEIGKHDRAFAELEIELQHMPQEQYASEWSRSFSHLLKIAGWPGPRALGSQEYQAVEAFNGLLSTLATLDAVSGRVPLDTAFCRLRRMAESARFQVENTIAAVQITGLLEAEGLRFEHLWVMGLHDDAIPPRANPNPFLPIHLQRKFGLPHCSAERELDFSTRLLDRLAASAPNVILSYPEWEGDQPLGPSPLLPGRTAKLEIPRIVSWASLIRNSATHEFFEDSAAPPLPDGFEVKGGTSILKNMAACPFRAYADNRLRARALENPRLGLDARDKGTAVHKMLEIVWAELKSHRNLLGLPQAEREQLIGRACEAALAGYSGPGAMLERVRLQRLLSAWLDVERGRPPFTVLDHEREQYANVGGLPLSLRIDRVDELPDGRRIIIDYKTGDVKTNVWSGDRLDEPQVPLYCVSHREGVAAAAFAQIRTGALQFQGVSENGELGKMAGMRLEKGLSLAELIDEWERVLDKLGRDFRKGVAVVAPKHASTCDFCDLPALCRIHDDHS